jgi:hypothetical protein
MVSIPVVVSVPRPRALIALAIFLAAPACGHRGAPGAARRTQGGLRDAAPAGGRNPDAGDPAVRAISVPGIAQGVLQDGDRVLVDGSLGDEFSFGMAAGETVTIVTRGGPSQTRPGTPLDVYTVLTHDGLEVGHDDDSAYDGHALNSRIVFTAHDAGSYVVRVTTYGRGPVRGAYQLQTYAGGIPDQL